MQEEGAAKGVNPALEKHWEKLVLGVVVILAVVFLGSKLSGGGNSAAKSVDSVVNEATRRIGDKNDRIEAPKAVPQATIAASSPANRPGEWTSSDRTRFDFIPKEGTAAPPKTFKFPPVTLSAPAVEPNGKVTLKWTAPKIEAEPNENPKPLIVPRNTFFYVIERREKGGEWKALDPQYKSDKESLTYQDDDTVPKTDYEYRVTLGSTDSVFSKSFPKMLTDKIGGPAPASTPGIWFVEFSNIEDYPDAEPPKPGQAYVTIKKYDKTHGLVVWRKIQHEGEELGVIKVNGVEDSKHSVSDQNGRTVVVDFKFGGKIKKIKRDKVVHHTYKVCDPKINNNGLLECSGPETKSEPYRVHEVVYSDEDGKDQAFTALSGPAPMADKLCPEHGGPPPPRELSADERLAQREKDAEKMMDKAEELWSSERSADKKEAQKIYKDLLSSFSDLEIVKSRKSEITERSKKKL